MVFISGNMPMKTEIVPLLIITKLEQYDYRGATAIAVVMLVSSLSCCSSSTCSRNGAAGTKPYDVIPCWGADARCQGSAAPPGPSAAQPFSLTLASAIATTLSARPARAPLPRATRDPAWARWLLTAVALAFLACFLVLPIVVVFARRSQRAGAYFLAAVCEPDALAAIRLTLLTVAIVVPANVLFGVAAAWAIRNSSSPARAS